MFAIPFSKQFLIKYVAKTENHIDLWSNIQKISKILTNEKSENFKFIANVQIALFTRIHIHIDHSLMWNRIKFSDCKFKVIYLLEYQALDKFLFKRLSSWKLNKFICHWNFVIINTTHRILFFIHLGNALCIYLFNYSFLGIFPKQSSSKVSSSKFLLRWSLLKMLSQNILPYCHSLEESLVEIIWLIFLMKSSYLEINRLGAI